MKKLLFVLIVALLGASVAFAQGKDEIKVGGEKGISVNERITVHIPPRVALHIQDNHWDLSLKGELNAWNPKGHTGCLLVPKSQQYGVTNAHELRKRAYYGPERFSYPAFISDRDGGVAMHDKLGWLKGGLVCQNTKVIQKFANSDGWVFTVSAPEMPTTVGKFFIGEYIDAAPGQIADAHANPQEVYADGPFKGHLLAKGNGTTHGFLDDIIYEGFYFDGTEMAGNYDFNLVFTLTGNF